MSATYNWAYRPGVTNKYGIGVPNSADNVPPVAWAYVALFGNDVTGNGSRQLPYKTIGKALSVNAFGTICIGSGIYREQVITGANNQNIIGDGDVVLDFSYFPYALNGYGGGSIYNVYFKGADNQISGNPAGTTFTMRDCTLYRCLPTANTRMEGTYINCVISNLTANMRIDAQSIMNCTFYMCNSLNLNSTNIRSAIFSNCNINFSFAQLYPTYSLFYQCNFRFTNSIQTGGVLYPSVPSGYTYITSIATVHSNMTAAYPSVTVPCQYCIIADPIFNNAAIGDYTLSFDSPAKNLSYFGTYIGAKSIAYPIKAKATESAGGFEFSSAVNIAIADGSITLTNPAIDAQIDTNVIVNTLGRELANFPSYGFNADRNGQYIDSIADLDTVTKAAGDTLSIPVPYLVETGAIVYNGGNYQPGERFTTVIGQTTFTTIASGVVREILEAPQRHTIMARFTDGGAIITAGDALISGNYYYVQTGSVTYESVLYNAGVAFKAVNTNPFSGSGTVNLAFSTESFQHYEPGIKPTSNNVGDARAGAIVRGNGDPAYVRGGLGVKEFPINAKFIQIRYYIRVTNLKP